jgi:hypothetical protein
LFAGPNRQGKRQNARGPAERSGSIACPSAGSIFLEQGDQGEDAARAAGAATYVLKARAALDLADVVAGLKPDAAEAPE